MISQGYDIDKKIADIALPVSIYFRVKQDSTTTENAPQEGNFLQGVSS